MKIVVVIPSFYPAVVYGGTIFSSLNTCKALVHMGNEVYVSTTNTNMHNRLDVPANRWTDVEGIQVKYYNETVVDKISLPLLSRVWKDIRRADVVHIQAIFNTPVPAALFYARLLNKPVLLSPRGVMGDWIMNQGNSFKKYWMKFLIAPFAGKIVWHATAEQEAAEIRSRFPKAQIVVIPNGIDIAPFKKNRYLDTKAYLKKFTGQERLADKVVVSMGRLHKKKGFDLLIEAFAEIGQQENAVLLIAGQDEGEKQVLENKIAALNLQDRVFLTGPVHAEDKVDFLIHSDLFVLTSHNENFGNVYAEALASGIPVVASIHTPWQEVEEYACGRWVPLEKNKISDAMTALLKENKEEISIRCRNYVKRFSWDETAGKLQTQFSEML